MPAILGQLLGLALYADPQAPNLSADLDTYVEGWEPFVATAPAGIVGPRLAGLVSLPTARRDGHLVNAFFQDFYFRAHITPRLLNLGSLVSVQQREVTVWNAFPDQGLTLTDTPIIGGDGIDITPPGLLPLAFTPLQERTWTVSVGVDGPPVIDATWTFEFAEVDPITVEITGNRITAWTLVPDWKDGILERLAWLTAVLASPTGAEQNRALRQSPRRTFEATFLVDGPARSYLDLSVYGWSRYRWALPIWPDIVWLGTPLSLGATVLPCDTAGRDFVAGGLAMLRDADPDRPRRYEVVEIDAIAGDSLTLLKPTAQAWPAGTRLYPVRLAQLAQAPQTRRLSDRAVRAQVQFELVEASDWPAVWPGTLYRGFPVLTTPPEESEELTGRWQALQETLEDPTGFDRITTTSPTPYALQQHRWLLHGRSEQAAFRSLLYAFEGRCKAAWVPTFAADLDPVATITAAGVTIDIAAVDYPRFAQLGVGRRDLRIELFDGTAFHRRITGASTLDADTERLLLDAALGMDVTPDQVRRISFMALCRQETDSVEIRHLTDADGTARSAMVFRGKRDDL